MKGFDRMCFSAPFSFAAAGGLGVLGAATFATAPKSHRILVAIPLLFACQQAFEGVQWLYLNRGATSPTAGYAYLLFALISWPLYIPAFVFVLDKPHRKVLKGFIVLGSLVACYFSALLITQPLNIHVHAGSIHYIFNFRHQGLVLPAYLIAVMGPLFISSVRIFRWFGLGISLLAVVSWRLYTFNFLSVWCFFAAIVSAVFFLYLQFENAAQKKNRA